MEEEKAIDVRATNKPVAEPTDTKQEEWHERAMTLLRGAGFGAVKSITLNEFGKKGTIELRVVLAEPELITKKLAQRIIAIKQEMGRVMTDTHLKDVSHCPEGFWFKVDQAESDPLMADKIKFWITFC